MRLATIISILAAVGRRRGMLKTVVCMTSAVMLAGTSATAAPLPYEDILGDHDNFSYDGPGSIDDVYVDPDWVSQINEHLPGHPPVSFDKAESARSVAFTFLFDLEPADITGAELLIGLGRKGSPPETDHIFIDSFDGSHTFNLDDLGWLPIPWYSEGSSLRILDLSDILGTNLLDTLSDGKLNVVVDDDMAIDYVTLRITPEPTSLALLALGSIPLLRRRRRIR